MNLVSTAGLYQKLNTQTNRILHVKLTQSVDLALSVLIINTFISHVIRNLKEYLAQTVLIEESATKMLLIGILASKKNSSNIFARMNRCKASHLLVIYLMSPPKRSGISGNKFAKMMKTVIRLKKATRRIASNFTYRLSRMNLSSDMVRDAGLTIQGTVQALILHTRTLTTRTRCSTSGKGVAQTSKYLTLSNHPTILLGSLS